MDYPVVIDIQNLHINLRGVKEPNQLCELMDCVTISCSFSPCVFNYSLHTGELYHEEEVFSYLERLLWKK